MNERSVEREGVRLEAEEAGEGIPVVLLHGLTATRRYVVMGSRALERSGHRVISYDARGHGRSTPAPRYDYADLAADLLAVLDAFEVERAVLVGASMGAHTMLRTALDAPQRVSGLVLVTPAFDPTAARDFASWDALATGLCEDGVEGFVAANHVERMPVEWQATIRTVLHQRMAQHEHLDAVAEALREVPRSRPFESFDELDTLAVPAVVVASRDDADPGHPLAVGERYAAAIPGARVLTEEPGKSPLAWQGGQLSRIVADLAARTELMRT